MFDQLMNLVKQYSGDAVINNPDVPNEHNDAVISTAGNSIMDTLKGMMSGGGASDVLNLFSQNNNQDIANHPVTQNVSSNLITTLMNKFGLDSNKAGGIAGSLIPMVMNQLVHKTNDSNDSSFNLRGILSSLGGNGAGGMDIGSLVSKFGGNALDKNHDGQVNMADLTAAFSGNNNTESTDPKNDQNTEEKGGGIIDSIKGLFGK